MSEKLTLPLAYVLLKLPINWMRTMLIHQKGFEFHDSGGLLVYGLVISIEMHILGRLSRTARLLFSTLITFSCKGY